MRKIALLAAVAAVAAAAPASANEGRVEARGGIAWAGGVEEAVAGVAAGYDFDLGTGAFAGVEASADKVLASGAEVAFGGTARAGAKLGDAGKLYALAGYTFNGVEAFHAGAGYEHKLGERVYLKAEYRRYFDFIDFNAAIVGVGMTF